MRTRRLGTRTRGMLVAAAVALVVLVAVGLAAVGALTGLWSSRGRITTEDVTLSLPESPGSPGTVDIDARLYLPDTPDPVPAVLLAHGFGGSKESVDGPARRLAEDGFVALTYSARGFGRSSGRISMNDPDREVADARGLVDWLAQRPEVELDADGDPRIGVEGGSYGGALALMLGGTDPRIDAIAASITWNDLGQALFPNHAVPADTSGGTPGTPAASVVGGPGVLKRGWAGAFLSGASGPRTGGPGDTEPGDGPGTDAPGGAGPCGRFAPEFCADYAQSAVTGVPTPELLALLRAHSPAAVASHITAPTLLVQGERDTLFGLDQADATARQIAAAAGAVQVRWFDGGHDAPGASDASERAVRDFLAAHLSDGASGAPGPAPFHFALPGTVTEQAEQRVRWMTAPDYPGLATSVGPTPTRSVPLSAPGQPQSILRPPGAAPAAVSSVPGFGAALAELTGSASLPSIDPPGQSANFHSAPLREPLTVTGTSTVRLTVRATAQPGEAVLFAKLYDLAPDGRRTLPGGGVSAMRLPDSPSGAPVDLTVTLPGITHLIPQGHRIEVVVSTTDQAYAVPLNPAQFTVTLSDPMLTVPQVPAETTGGTVPLGPLIGIAALLAAAALIITTAGIRARRRAVAEVDPDLTDTPLVVTDLTKTYPTGLRAVDGVGFTVRRGQVVGLLGPNGAGKTTTLRMLMGLITPSAGDIRVFGHPATPGAPVLSRIGSFVEGAGFLPHLSGIENLRLYWQATGRPEHEAHLSETLEIADLGAAVERKVRSYSHGMRQRLAIAQAMLGLPDLLVLDEPTNGLDPPQIRTMRGVLVNYARTGRTVLVSSHLLAEVEQTCTHVVVMNRGRVISTGSIHELTSTGGPTEVRVNDIERATEVLRGFADIGSVHVTEGAEPSLQVDLGGTDPAAVVRALVTAGVEVRGLSRSTRLEDVFLDLVHSAAVHDATVHPTGGREST